jgi:hypothetical protein
MSITQSTYLEEAGETDLVKQRLRHEDRKLLETVPTMEGTLSAVMDEWIKTGNELGTLERDRARKVDGIEAGQTVSRADVVQARNRWIRVVRAILTGLELADEVDDKTRALILQPLRLAVAKAAQKNKLKDQEYEDALTEQLTTTTPKT